MQLENLRLLTLDEVRRFSYYKSVLYVLCFDVGGLVVKIGRTRCAQSRIDELTRQAAPCKEIWIYEDVHAISSVTHFLRQHFINRSTENGYFRVPVGEIDRAITGFVNRQFGSDVATGEMMTMKAAA